jgi:hypothetical protein
MQIAVLVVKGEIIFYDYTCRAPPYDGTPGPSLPILGCDILRNPAEDKTVWMLPLHGEGLLQMTIPRESDLLFAGASKEKLASYMVAVHRGRKPKLAGYELELLALPCFIENGIVFSLVDIMIRNQVKTMR